MSWSSTWRASRRAEADDLAKEVIVWIDRNLSRVAAAIMRAGAMHQELLIA